MSAISSLSPIIVVDANVAMWAILPILSAGDVLERFDGWWRAGVRLVAPTLWLAECIAAIRGSVYARVISPQEGRVAVGDLFDLGVETAPMDQELCRSAFEWAERLGQARAYDGFYLALAERLGAELWTADGRLARGAQQAGAVWVRGVGEANGGLG
jgi:predicted nucleic acid-binding protein